MKGKIVTIGESGVVSIPDNVMMRDFEIAELFEVMMPTVHANHPCDTKNQYCNSRLDQWRNVGWLQRCAGLSRAGYGYGSRFSDSITTDRGVS